MKNKQRGYFGIGIINGKSEVNIGTLWRSANIFNAQFIFTIGKKYPRRGQSSDTMKTHRHIPLFEYDNFDEFKKHLPRNCNIIAIEINEKSKSITDFKHPESCVYLLGAEDTGISKEVLKQCNQIVQLPGDYCLNVSVAGSLVMYDRINKRNK